MARLAVAVQYRRVFTRQAELAPQVLSPVRELQGRKRGATDGMTATCDLRTANATRGPAGRDILRSKGNGRQRNPRTERRQRRDRETVKRGRKRNQKKNLNA